MRNAVVSLSGEWKGIAVGRRVVLGYSGFQIGMIVFEKILVRLMAQMMGVGISCGAGKWVVLGVDWVFEILSVVGLEWVVGVVGVLWFGMGGCLGMGCLRWEYGRSLQAKVWVGEWTAFV
jgi:hypothetical protein